MIVCWSYVLQSLYALLARPPLISHKVEASW
jgi:hypothetical protein